jgi:hypothetical protein
LDNARRRPANPYVDLNARISDFHFHDLRHTIARQMGMSAADLNPASGVVGPKIIKMTLWPALKTNEIERIDAAFSTPQVTPKLTDDQDEAAVNFATQTNKGFHPGRFRTLMFRVRM